MKNECFYNRTFAKLTISEFITYLNRNTNQFFDQLFYHIVNVINKIFRKTLRFIDARVFESLTIRPTMLRQRKLYHMIKIAN